MLKLESQSPRSSAASTPPAYNTLQNEIYGRCFVSGNYPLGWPKHEQCPCCCSTRIHYRFRKWAMLHWTCSHCKFTFANPFPSPALLSELYNGSYMRAVRNYVEIPKAVAGRHDTSCSMEGEYYSEILQYITSRASGGSWLDVGGGIGTFLHRVQGRFPSFSCYLNELNHDSADFARQFYGLQVLEAPVEEIVENGQRFDVITALAVLEHCSHPKQFVTKLVQLLKSGGVLFINVPHFTRFCRLFSQGASPNVCAPFHLSLFSRRNLIEIVQRAGPVKVTACWEVGPPAFQLTHLARTAECDDIRIPEAPCETQTCFRRLPLTPLQQYCVRKLAKLDRSTIVQRALRKLDGGVYINLAATKVA